MNPCGIEVGDVVEASAVVGDFWRALAAEDMETLGRLVTPEILDVVDDPLTFLTTVACGQQTERAAP